MTNRIRSILQQLEQVREDLLALSDDIWLSIDHNDNQALQEGVAFKKEYNAKVAARTTRIEAGKKRAEQLRKAFADWYYVIDAASFSKLRPTRAQLVQAPEPAIMPPGAAPAAPPITPTPPTPH